MEEVEIGKHYPLKLSADGSSVTLLQFGFKPPCDTKQGGLLEMSEGSREWRLSLSSIHKDGEKEHYAGQPTNRRSESVLVWCGPQTGFEARYVDTQVNLKHKRQDEDSSKGGARRGKRKGISTKEVRKEFADKDKLRAKKAKSTKSS